jgi:hypothetical protein
MYSLISQNFLNQNPEYRRLCCPGEKYKGTNWHQLWELLDELNGEKTILSKQDKINIDLLEEVLLQIRAATLVKNDTESAQRALIQIRELADRIHKVPALIMGTASPTKTRPSNANSQPCNQPEETSKSDEEIVVEFHPRLNTQAELVAKMENILKKRPKNVRLVGFDRSTLKKVKELFFHAEISYST